MLLFLVRLQPDDPLVVEPNTTDNSVVDKRTDLFLIFRVCRVNGLFEKLREALIARKQVLSEVVFQIFNILDVLKVDDGDPCALIDLFDDKLRVGRENIFVFVFKVVIDVQIGLL